MRVLGIDFGRRRIGVAISDATATLARPLTMIPAQRSLDQTVQEIARLVERLSSDDQAIGEIVVGLPKRLDGTPNDQTAPATEFARALGAAVPVPIRLQDERLTSHEADSRLAETDRDWRTRKSRLDAAAAAIILQDYLDARRPGRDSRTEHE